MTSRRGCTTTVDKVQFFKGYYDAVRNLSDEEKGRCLTVLLEYVFYDTVPGELNAIENVFFTMAKPSVDKSIMFSETGKRGGAPSGNSNAKKGQKTTKNKGGCFKNEKGCFEKQPKTTEEEVEEEVEVEEEIEKEYEKDILKESEKRKAKPAKRFTPPTLEEIKKYCLEAGLNHVDAERFVDYYEGNGWMVGRNKMKDWKATCRNWNRQDARGHRSDSKPKTNSFTNFQQRDEIDWDAVAEAQDREFASMDLS